MNVNKHYQAIRQIIEDITSEGIDDLKVNNTSTTDDLVANNSATVSGRNVLEDTGASINPGLANNTYRTPSADRPTLVTLGFEVNTDGTTDGIMSTYVYESGDTATLTYGQTAYADAGAGSHKDIEHYTFIVPAGGTYRWLNDTDPTGLNQLDLHREITL